jgi:small subunit ribosomal protein S5
MADEIKKTDQSRKGEAEAEEKKITNEPKTSQGGFEVSKESQVKKKTTRKFVNKKFDKKKGNRRGPSKPRSEFEQKIISLRRVTRVVAGGRRFSFSVGMVIGDRLGSVGVGLGKASDTALAIEKAIRDAKKNMIKPALTKTNSIHHDVEAKYCASRVMMVPTPGKGLKAGGAMRTILDLLGVKDVTGKIFSRSKNHVNNAKATIKALKQLGTKSPIKVVKTETNKEVKKASKKEEVSVK